MTHICQSVRPSPLLTKIGQKSPQISELPSRGLPWAIQARLPPFSCGANVPPQASPRHLPGRCWGDGVAALFGYASRQTGLRVAIQDQPSIQDGCRAGIRRHRGNVGAFSTGIIPRFSRCHDIQVDFRPSRNTLRSKRRHGVRLSCRRSRPMSKRRHRAEISVHGFAARNYQDDGGPQIRSASAEYKDGGRCIAAPLPGMPGTQELQKSSFAPMRK